MIQSQPDGTPWTAVDRWARRYRLSDEDFEMLDRCIMAMDEVYREWWIERNKRRDAE